MVRHASARDFLDAVERAESESQVIAVSHLMKPMPSTPTAVLVWLERRFPQEWSRTERHELTGAEGGPVQVEDYPRAWRERYGEELSAQLEAQRPLRIGVVADLVRGALDAHMHPLRRDTRERGLWVVCARGYLSRRSTPSDGASHPSGRRSSPFRAMTGLGN